MPHFDGMLFRRSDVAGPWYATCPSGRYFVNGQADLDRIGATRDMLCLLPASHALWLEPIRGPLPPGASAATADTVLVPDSSYDPPK